MSTGRLVLENVLKYGFRVDFYLPLQFLADPTAWPSALALACMNIFIFFSLTIEKLLEQVSAHILSLSNYFHYCIFSIITQGKIKERHGNFLSVLNVFMAIVSPPVYLWYRKANPSNILTTKITLKLIHFLIHKLISVYLSLVSSCIALLFYTSLSMKLWSYFSVNRAHRYVRKHGLREHRGTSSDQNLTNYITNEG